MNILFVGATTSTFSANMAWKLNQYEEITIDAIFSSNRINEKQNYLDKYAHIFFYKFYNSIKIPKINGFLNTLMLIIRLLTLKKYDIIHLQLIAPSMLYLMPFLKYKSNKIVSTVWGSDLDLCQNISYFKSVLNYSDLITCETENFKKRLEIVLNNPKKKIRTLPFSQQIVDELDSLKGIRKQQAKINLGIPPGKIVIVCGTNLRKMQHHIEIVDEINLVKEKFNKPVIVLIQMTYGFVDLEYLNCIEKKLTSIGLDYIILSKSLTDKEVAMLRMASDILVQIQDHDQLSSAMMETLYAKNIIVTGSWLPYTVLDTEGVCYFKVDNISELGEILLKCVNNYEQLCLNTNKNQKIIGDIIHHNTFVKKWMNTYKAIIS